MNNNKISLIPLFFHGNEYVTDYQFSLISNSDPSLNFHYTSEKCLNTLNFYENLFRLIFETQIHIQIHIRYFKSTYYLTTIHIKNLYQHSKNYNMGLK